MLRDPARMRGGSDLWETECRAYDPGTSRDAARRVGEPGRRLLHRQPRAGAEPTGPGPGSGNRDDGLLDQIA